MAGRGADSASDDDSPVRFRVLSGPQWRLARAARRAALRDSPESFLPIDPREPQWRGADWQRSCETGRWAVAVSRGTPVGLARLTFESTGAHIGSVWTSPRFRRAGIATELVRLLVRAAPQSDVYVWVIEPNPAAFQLYESLGFQRTSERQLLEEFGRVEERLWLSGAFHRR